MTKLSVVTINRNNLMGLKRTYQSIRQHISTAQLEWIVIDGNSGEETVKFLKGLENSVNWISEPDKGIYDAMNKGLELVTGDYVWFLNSGDIALNFSQMSKYLHKANLFQISVFDWKRDYGIRRRRKSKYLWTMYHSLPTRHQAIIYSTKSIGEIKYSTKFKIAGDFEFTAKIWNANKKLFVRVPMTICKFESGGISSHNRALLASEAWEIQRSIFRLPKWLCEVSKFFRLKFPSARISFFDSKNRAY
jgi:putative colanic acid biosynthesis glycosyltransferase